MAPGVDKLKRMKARLKGTAADELPAPYAIKCDCGGEIEGTRNPTSKQTCCPDCLTELYLLPTNVYPETTSVPSDVISGGFTHRLAVVAKELLPGRRKANSPAAPADSKSSRKKSESAKENVEAAEVSKPKRRLGLPSFNPVRTARRIFTPLRLVVMGMLLAIAGTLGVMWNQNRMETARTTWHDSMDVIPELMAQGDFSELESELVAATDAGRILGQNGQEWRHAFNLLEETRVISTVALSTLPVTMSEAGFSRQTTSDDAESLKALLTKGTFVVDGYIDPANGKYKFTLDIPVMPGQPSVIVSLELAELQEYLATSESHRSVFAFRVSDVRSPPNDSADPWIVEVDPLSFVLFTSTPHCEQLGWPVEDESEFNALLTQQREFIEGSDEWSQRHERIREQLLARAGE